MYVKDNGKYYKIHRFYPGGEDGILVNLTTKKDWWFTEIKESCLECELPENAIVID